MIDSVTQLTQRYLQLNPNVRYCLTRGLINYSALARDICKQIGEEKFDAVVAACRRYKAKSRGVDERERSIARLIKNARVRMKNKISVVIIDKPRDFEPVFVMQRRVRKERGTFQFIEGEEALTLIIESQELEQIRSAFSGRIKRVTNGLTQILMIFNKNIETTPGVVSHIFALLGANGINIVEEMSCWTDVMLVVSEKEAPMVAELLAQ